MAHASWLRDSKSGMRTMESVLVGKLRVGGVLLKSFWVFQGNSNGEKLKMVSTEGIQTPGLLLLLFSLRK